MRHMDTKGQLGVFKITTCNEGCFAKQYCPEPVILIWVRVQPCIYHLALSMLTDICIRQV